MFAKLKLDFLWKGQKALNISKAEDNVNSSLDDESKSPDSPADSLEDSLYGKYPHSRCDWVTIDSIPKGLYEKLVSELCTISGPPKPANYVRCNKGTYNTVSFIEVAARNEFETYIVRVPGHATIEHWTTKDAYMMQREVEIIEYIGQHTSAPVPRVCAYSTTFNNTLGHPYIMTTELPGESARSIWFDDDIHEAGCETYFRYGDLPSPAVEQKRINFLRSLAKIMAGVNKLSFVEIGMPIIPVDGSAFPSVGPLYQWDNSGDDDYIERPVFTSTQDYVRTRPSSLRMSDAIFADSTTQNYILGARTLLDMIFAQPVFNPSSPGVESFTLHHSDLDLQSILVDDEGNVTGIIDWGRCLSVPRCVGAASAPLFLQKDWMPAYLNKLDTAPYMTFGTHRYRQIYAAALAEHGCEDAKYTSKSAMYQAAVIALYYGDHGDVHDFLAKVLRCVPEFRGDVLETIWAFGAGWPAGEHLMQRLLKNIFEPEIPEFCVLAEADAAIAAMDWMMGFEYDAQYETAQNDC